MAQEVEEILVRVRADTRSAEEELRRFGRSASEALDGGPRAGSAGERLAQAAQSNSDAIIANGRTAQQQLRFQAREARRDVRETLAQIKDQLADTSAFSGAGIIDEFFGIDEARIQATRFAGTIQDLEAQFRGGIIGKQQYDLEVAEAERGIREIEKRWSSLGGTLRGLGATVGKSLFSGLIVGGTIGVVTTVFQGLGAAVTNAIDPFKRVSAAANDYAAQISKLGNAKKISEILGITEEEAQRLSDYADDVKSLNSALATLTAEQKLNLEAAKLGIAPDDPLLAAKAAAGELTQTFLAQSYAAQYAEGGVNALEMGLMGLGAILTGTEGGAQQFRASLDRIFNPDAVKNIDEETLALIRNRQARQRLADTRDNLVQALRSGNSLTDLQLALLSRVTSETERQVILNAINNRERQRAIDLTAELVDVNEDIALLEGRRSGDTNKDALADIDKARERLDRTERALADREFRRKRQEALDQMAANMERAGIRQAGQTSFDVYAAQREAEAQNARERQGFVDEDTRRRIESARDVLDVRERAIRREIDLDRLRASKLRIEQDLNFENAITGVGELTDAVIQSIQLIYGAITGALVGGANIPTGTGTSTPNGGGSGIPAAPGRGGAPRASSVLVPRNTGALVPMAQSITIEPSDVIIDGEVIGRILERRVTSRSNRRAALGIA
jgi:hypothetical protein